MNDSEFYLKLSSGFQPFAREHKFLESLCEVIRPFADEIWFDAYGSLIAHKKGTGKKIMISAQADVPTVLITYPENETEYRFLITGKRPVKIENHSMINFFDGVTGVIEFDDDCDSYDCSQMRICVKQGNLHVGDKGIVYDRALIENGFISGAHCTEAAGCMLLIKLLERNKLCDADIYYVFSVGSESDMVSQRGVLCATYQIKPDIGISIEAIVADSFVLQGNGPVVLLCDEHAILRDSVLKKIRKTCQKTSIRLQYATLNDTKRETALYHYQCSGADSYTLAFPYMNETLNRRSVSLSDFQQCISFVESYLQYES